MLYKTRWYQAEKGYIRFKKKEKKKNYINYYI